MLVTGLMLVPVLAVLLWVYWYLLPITSGRRLWSIFDSILWMVLSLLAGLFCVWAFKKNWLGAGAIWPYVVAAAGAYTIFAGGMLVGLVYRRQRSRS